MTLKSRIKSIILPTLSVGLLVFPLSFSSVAAVDSSADTNNVMAAEPVAADAQGVRQDLMPFVQYNPKDDPNSAGEVFSTNGLRYARIYLGMISGMYSKGEALGGYTEFTGNGTARANMTISLRGMSFNANGLPAPKPGDTNSLVSMLDKMQENDLALAPINIEVIPVDSSKLKSIVPTANTAQTLVDYGNKMKLENAQPIRFTGLRVIRKVADKFQVSIYSQKNTYIYWELGQDFLTYKNTANPEYSPVTSENTYFLNDSGEIAFQGDSSFSGVEGRPLPYYIQFASGTNFIAPVISSSGLAFVGDFSKEELTSSVLFKVYMPAKPLLNQNKSDLVIKKSEMELSDISNISNVIKENIDKALKVDGEDATFNENFDALHDGEYSYQIKDDQGNIVDASALQKGHTYTVTYALKQIGYDNPAVPFSYMKTKTLSIKIPLPPKPSTPPTNPGSIIDNSSINPTGGISTNSTITGTTNSGGMHYVKDKDGKDIVPNTGEISSTLIIGIIAIVACLIAGFTTILRIKDKRKYNH